MLVYMLKPDEREEVYGQFCSDIVVTAIEGGINYWVDNVNDYQWDCMWSMVQAYINVPEEHIVPSEGVEKTRYFINYETADAGLRVIMKNVDIFTATGWENRVAKAIVNLDAGDFDASDADTIIQVGLFGKQVFA